ncbi:MAG: sugar ABC transporter permease [Gaiellaceae bacterium]|jgi:raffinose/stachyose/melibiose transport system permease protein
MKAGRARTGSNPLLALPALALFGLFALAPMIVVTVLSFTYYDGINPPKSAGFANWNRFMHDSTTHHAILLTLEIMALSWLFQTPLALLLGVFLAGRQRYRALLGAVYFIPLLFSAAAIGITWMKLLDPNFGLLSNLIHRLHMGWFPNDWLGSQGLALYMIVFIISWQFIPFHTLLYQAGARQIPRSVYEAAEIDGAGRLRQFLYVTLPLLRNTVVTSSMLIIVGSLTYFDLIFVTTGGGPGFATRILPLDMYINGFQRTDMGYASTISVVLVVASLFLSLLLIRVTGFGRFRSAHEGA